ncbi:MAG: ImuA family protein [Bythopirellula sp.]
MQDQVANPPPISNQPECRTTSRLEQLCTSLQLAKAVTPKYVLANNAGALQRLTGKLGPKRLIDCLATSTGCGAGLIGLLLCLRACQRAGEIVVVDGQQTFFPPVAAAWGVDTNRLLVVRPQTQRDAVAAALQALRSPAVAAVWASLDRIDPKSSRRLLLAAESADAFGILVRPARYRRDPSWSDIQLCCEPIASTDEQADQLLVRLFQTRNRHGPVAGEAIVSLNWRTGTIQEWIDHELTEDDEHPNVATHPVPRAARLASATLPPKAS